MSTRILRLSMWPLVNVFLPGLLACCLWYVANLGAFEPEELQRMFNPLNYVTSWALYVKKIWHASPVLAVFVFATLSAMLRRWYREPTQANGLYLFLAACLCHEPGYRLVKLASNILAI